MKPKVSKFLNCKLKPEKFTVVNFPYLKDHWLKERERIEGDNTEGSQVIQVRDDDSWNQGGGSKAREKWIPFQYDYEVELIV